MGVIAVGVRNAKHKATIHKSHSLLVGGIFLFVAFGSEMTPDIELEQVRIAYIVFLVTTGAGIILLLLLRSPRRSK